MKPLILVTNDDGYSSEGIQALAKTAMKYGDVVIVAPKTEQSNQGRAIPRNKEITVEDVSSNGMKTYAIDGTPATGHRPTTLTTTNTEGHR